jgi:predicted ATPase
MISKGLEEWRGTGSRLGLSYFLYLHADTALALGREDEAEAILSDAAAFARQSGEAFWKPEIMRLGSEIALVRGDHAGCVARLREAIDTAREMGLHGSELRAATALARRAPEGPDQLAAAQALTTALKSIADDDPAAAEGREVLHAMPARRLG